MNKKKIKIVVITGGHGFDVSNFHKLFNTLDSRIEPYIQHIDDFCWSPKAVRQSYDTVVFYIMMMTGPTDEGHDKSLTALGELGETKQGIVVLHHAILAYPQWSVWNQLVGINARQFDYHVGETVTAHIVNPEHSITIGLRDWTMTDETYTMADAGPGSEVLITYDHPKSMKTIAWTRQYRNSRVFCYQAGHDNMTWVDPNFRLVLSRGIEWSAGRI